MIEKITPKEFKGMFKNDDSRKKKFWQLFEVKCKKCGSENIEFFGEYGYERGYYDSVDAHGNMIVKCHSCGNAKLFRLDDLVFTDPHEFELLETYAKKEVVDNI